MEKIVLKFGGSSLADNEKLNIVANKIIDFYNKNNKVVVVVSAQGKTTDGLIKQALELSSIPDNREMDVLLSTGEQISIAKLAILLKELRYNAISLTGAQAGILTNSNHQDAKIEKINITRINEELENNNIVIIAGFQGIDEKNSITTLGRGGSDTTAVAIAAAIKADHCYIFSDVDGVYSTDPKRVKNSKKIDNLSYKEMLELSDEGAKVLHNRCVEIAEKYNVLIETGSTFNNNTGTIINNKIEESSIKSIVKNDDLSLITLQSNTYNNDIFYNINKELLINNISTSTLINNNTDKLNISFTIKSLDLNKLEYLMEDKFKEINKSYINISRISLVGYGIANNIEIIERIFKILNQNNIEILTMQINETKISIMTKEKVTDKILEQLHYEFIG